MKNIYENFKKSRLTFFGPDAVIPNLGPKLTPQQLPFPGNCPSISLSDIIECNENNNSAFNHQKNDDRLLAKLAGSSMTSHRSVS